MKKRLENISTENISIGEILSKKKLKNIDYKILEKLLKEGEDPDQQLARGKKENKKSSARPLFKAAVKLDSRLMELLLNHKANPNIRDTNNNNPLHILFKKRNNVEKKVEERKKIIDLLMNSGADINANNKDKKTPINIAIENGYYDEALYIINKYKDKLDKHEIEFIKDQILKKLNFPNFLSFDVCPYISLIKIYLSCVINLKELEPIEIKLAYIVSRDSESNPHKISEEAFKQKIFSHIQNNFFTNEIISELYQKLESKLFFWQNFWKTRNTNLCKRLHLTDQNEIDFMCNSTRDIREKYKNVEQPPILFINNAWRNPSPSNRKLPPYLFLNMTEDTQSDELFRKQNLINYFHNKTGNMQFAINFVIENLRALKLVSKYILKGDGVVTYNNDNLIILPNDILGKICSYLGNLSECEAIKLFEFDASSLLINNEPEITTNNTNVREESEEEYDHILDAIIVDNTDVRSSVESKKRKLEKEEKVFPNKKPKISFREKKEEEKSNSSSKGK
ncbi:MAG: ankyrin repeat domain-containing protein [Sphingobacteriia bacterium]|nr:ankyrin repeat domain-containing protein [Sphingobacteriia bacterium]